VPYSELRGLQFTGPTATIFRLAWQRAVTAASWTQIPRARVQRGCPHAEEREAVLGMHG